MDLVRSNEKKCIYLSDILKYQYEDQPDMIAVVYAEREYTYSDVYLISLGLSSKIGELLQWKSGRIAILMKRSANYIIAYFASLFSGSVIIPIDPELTSEEIKRTIEYCEADIILCDSKYDSIRKIINEENHIEVNQVNYDYYAQSIISDNTVTGYANPDEEVLLLHTSGSIDRPKRVMLTHRNIIENASAHVLHMNLKPEQKVLIALPMHFGYCNTAQIISHFLLGGTIIIMDQIFSPHKFCQLVNDYQVNVFTAVPAMLIQLANFKHYDKYNCNSLEQITFGGAPFPTERFSDVKEKFGNVKLCQTYGLTEAGPRVTGVSPDSGYELSNTVGTLLPGVQVKVIDENDYEVNSEKTGQIIVKSAGVMKGYYKREDETKKVLRDGWLYTGDLGYFDKYQNLFIVGRIKNVIIRAGVNIYPEEIETYLLKHSMVKEVLVQGVEDINLGEVPHAKIIPTDENASIAEISEFCKVGLARYKIPTIEFVQELPHTYNKKIKRLQ